MVITFLLMAIRRLMTTSINMVITNSTYMISGKGLYGQNGFLVHHSKVACKSRNGSGGVPGLFLL